MTGVPRSPQIREHHHLKPDDSRGDANCSSLRARLEVSVLCCALRLQASHSLSPCPALSSAPFFATLGSRKSLAPVSSSARLLRPSAARCGRRAAATAAACPPAPCGEIQDCRGSFPADHHAPPGAVGVCPADDRSPPSAPAAPACGRAPPSLVNAGYAWIGFPAAGAARIGCQCCSAAVAA